VSHESVIASLKRLTNMSILSMVPETHIPHIDRESDRASIVLFAALIENFVQERLKELMPSLNADEKARIFGFEGPCGSFSNRIRMAQALEMIDRPTRRKLELIKEMRNVAAHANTEITFDTPEIKEAVLGLFDVEARQGLARLNRKAMRYLFEMVCKRANVIVVHPEIKTLDTTKLLAETFERAEKHLASLDPGRKHLRSDLDLLFILGHCPSPSI
jgi:hypothetical protein